MDLPIPVLGWGGGWEQATWLAHQFCPNHAITLPTNGNNCLTSTIRLRLERGWEEMVLIILVVNKKIYILSCAALYWANRLSSELKPWTLLSYAAHCTVWATLHPNWASPHPKWALSHPNRASLRPVYQCAFDHGTFYILYIHIIHIGCCYKRADFATATSENGAGIIHKCVI